MLNFKSVGPGFEGSHSEHFMDLFHGSSEFSNPSAPSDWVSYHFMCHLQYLFQLFELYVVNCTAIPRKAKPAGLHNHQLTLHLFQYL